jgi:hypothetical protein
MSSVRLSGNPISGADANPILDSCEPNVSVFPG